VVQQAVQQRAGPVAGARMNHQTGRFINDDQVLIFINDVQRIGSGLKASSSGRLGQNDDLLVAVDGILGAFGHFTVDRDVPSVIHICNGHGKIAVPDAK
jgi:hypothetical protein